VITLLCALLRRQLRLAVYLLLLWWLVTFATVTFSHCGASHARMSFLAVATLIGFSLGIPAAVAVGFALQCLPRSVRSNLRAAKSLLERSTEIKTLTAFVERLNALRQSTRASCEVATWVMTSISIFSQGPARRAVSELHVLRSRFALAIDGYVQDVEAEMGVLISDAARSEYIQLIDTAYRLHRTLETHMESVMSRLEYYNALLVLVVAVIALAVSLVDLSARLETG
jgi:hypothetical protein